MYIPLLSEHTCAENKCMQKNLPDSEKHSTYKSISSDTLWKQLHILGNWTSLAKRNLYMEILIISNYIKSIFTISQNSFLFNHA